MAIARRCLKCGDRLEGQGTICEVFGKYYHAKCYTCTYCNVMLLNKIIFYENGVPFCSDDYYAMLHNTTSLVGDS